MLHGKGGDGAGRTSCHKNVKASKSSDGLQLLACLLPPFLASSQVLRLLQLLIPRAVANFQNDSVPGTCYACTACPLLAVTTSGCSYCPPSDDKAGLTANAWEGSPWSARFQPHAPGLHPAPLSARPSRRPASLHHVRLTLLWKLPEDGPAGIPRADCPGHLRVGQSVSRAWLPRRS